MLFALTQFCTATRVDVDPPGLLSTAVQNIWYSTPCPAEIDISIKRRSQGRFGSAKQEEGISSMQGRERDVAAYTDAQREVRPRPILSLPPIATGALSGRLTPTQQLASLSENRPGPRFSGQQYGVYSPAESQGLSREYYYETMASNLGPHSDILSGSLNSNPKRAYRQRRKDPSCDACRERKVKVRDILSSMESG